MKKFISRLVYQHPKKAKKVLVGTFGSDTFTSQDGEQMKMEYGVRGFGKNGLVEFDENGNGVVYENSEEYVPSTGEYIPFTPDEPYTDQELLDAFGYGGDNY